MKTKDIVIGERYAVGHKNYPKEATVLAVKQERTVYDRDSIWDRHGHKVQDGVKVRYVDLDYKKEIHEAVVTPAEIHRTWDDQAERNKAKQASDARVKERDERIAKLAEKLTAEGIKARRSYHSSFNGRSSGRYVLEIDDLDAIEALIDKRVAERFAWMDGDVKIEKPAQ